MTLLVFQQLQLHDTLNLYSSMWCAGGWQTSQWLGGDDKYTKFVLLKENMDTQVHAASSS
jgi:hypothetical protein